MEDEINIEELKKMISYVSGNINRVGKAKPEKFTKETIEEAFINVKEKIINKEASTTKRQVYLQALKEIASFIVERAPEIYGREWTMNSFKTWLMQEMLPRYTGEYDKSKMIDTKNTGILEDPKTGKKVISYQPNKHAEPYVYTNPITNETIIIQTEGILYFAQYNGAKDCLYKHKITFVEDNKIKSQRHIYSNISRLELDESKQYAKAVVESLLSKNNLEYSNCGGYVGEIELVPKAGLGDSSLEELAKKGIRPINGSKYYIYTSPISAEAVFLHAKEEKDKNDAR